LWKPDDFSTTFAGRSGVECSLPGIERANANTDGYSDTYPIEHTYLNLRTADGDLHCYADGYGFADDYTDADTDADADDHAPANGGLRV
jgi:hypothetical protein